MTPAETPTEALRAEHERILAVLDAFEEMVERVAAGRTGWGALEDFLTFFRLFVGACHHGKEEDALFPALGVEGMSREQGPLGIMREEHRRGRALVAEMAGALPAAGRGNTAAREVLTEGAADYVDLIRGHIGKENPAVFDAADQLVSGPACRRLCEAYRSADARGFDGRSAEDLARLADDLLARTRGAGDATSGPA